MKQILGIMDTIGQTDRFFEIKAHAALTFLYMFKNKYVIILTLKVR